MTTNALVPLSVLAEQINTAHEKCQQFYGTMLAYARDCGEKLVQAKAQVAHGSWHMWIADNCNFAERTAQKYIQVYRNWEQIESISALDEADLSINGMLDAIADKSAPEMISRRTPTPQAPKPNLGSGASQQLRPGDRVRVNDPQAPDYGQLVVVAEIVQDAIAVTDKGALLLNQVELVERAVELGQEVTPPGVVTPRSLPPYGETCRKREPIYDTQESLDIPKKRDITVAALQDVLRRILDECGECLPQELIDEARELL